MDTQVVVLGQGVFFDGNCAKLEIVPGFPQGGNPVTQKPESCGNPCSWQKKGKNATKLKTITENGGNP